MNITMRETLLFSFGMVKKKKKEKKTKKVSEEIPTEPCVSLGK